MFLIRCSSSFEFIKQYLKQPDFSYWENCRVTNPFKEYVLHCCPTSLARWGNHNNESGQAASERHSGGQCAIVDELPHSITTALLCNRFCRQRRTQIQIRSTHSHAYKCPLLYFASRARKVISACTYHFQQTNQNLFPFPAWINQPWFSSIKHKNKIKPQTFKAHNWQRPESNLNAPISQLHCAGFSLCN